MCQNGKVLVLSSLLDIAIQEISDTENVKHVFSLQFVYEDYEPKNTFTFFCPSPGSKTQWLNDIKIYKSKWEQKHKRKENTYLLTVQQGAVTRAKE